MIITHYGYHKWAYFLFLTYCEVEIKEGIENNLIYPSFSPMLSCFLTSSPVPPITFWVPEFTFFLSLSPLPSFLLKFQVSFFYIYFYSITGGSIAIIFCSFFSIGCKTKIMYMIAKFENRAGLILLQPMKKSIADVVLLKINCDKDMYSLVNIFLKML